MSKKQKSSSAQAKGNPADHQQPKVGKVENDHNKQGNQPLTQKNEPERTPQSRQDRQDQVGANNQTSSRRGGAGGGRTRSGAG